MFDLGLVLLKIINNEKYLHRIRKIARKKNAPLLKSFFFFFKATERNHTGTKWNGLVTAHLWSVRAESLRLGPFLTLEEHVQRYLTTGPSTPGLRAKRSDFCKENFRFQEATCFFSLDSVNSGMDRQWHTWTRWSPLSCIQWIMELDVTRFRKTSTASLLTSVGSRLKFTHTGCACEYGISWREGKQSVRVMPMAGKQQEKPLGQEGV